MGKRRWPFLHSAIPADTSETGEVLGNDRVPYPAAVAKKFQPKLLQWA